jgi:Tol biopolymer transport system component
MNAKVRAHFAVVITFLFCISLSVTSSSAQNPTQTLVGVTELISVTSNGTQGNRESFSPSISADGRYIAFSSNASNLVNGDTNYYCDTNHDGSFSDNCTDVFVHDRVTGETTRVSVASDGTQGNNESGDWNLSTSISADGRYVAFPSLATNLVAGDTNGVEDIFVHDRETGVTTRLSVSSNGTQADYSSFHPTITADGRYVAFESWASNLVLGDTNGEIDVFMHDRITKVTTRLSVASDGTQGSGWYPFISADGRYIAFASGSDNLVVGDTNVSYDIFVHDRMTGETTRVSVSSDGSQGNDLSQNPSISGDGRYVAFESWATNLVLGDTNLLRDTFVHDRLTGETSRVSVASDGTQANGNPSNPIISADGRYVAFESWASNLVVGDTNSANDIFVHDRLTGETSRLSVASDGTQGNNYSWYPSISADGRSVVYYSFADNLVVGDTNNTCDTDHDYSYEDNCPDIFLHDVGYSVSGHVTDLGDNPLPGVNISAGYGYSVITDSQGDYTISGLPIGTYKISPSLMGYFFAPSRRSVSVPPDRVGINFTEGFPTFLPLIDR